MTPKKLDPLTTARSELASLAAERERTDDRLGQIAGEREHIAHAALTGHVPARERLDNLKREAGELADHSKDLEAAIAQAERNVAAAEAAAAAEERKAQARKSLALTDELETAGEAASEAMAAYVTAMNRVEAITASLRENGALSASAILIGINLKSATKSELIAADRIEATVPAGDRRTIAETVKSYVEIARRAARAELGEREGAEPVKEAA